MKKECHRCLEEIEEKEYYKDKHTMFIYHKKCVPNYVKHCMILQKDGKE